MAAHYTNEETFQVIAVWSEPDIQKDFTNFSRHSAVWQEISARLERCGIYRTAEDIKNRMTYLIRTYRQKRPRSGAAPPEWPFFNALNRILGSTDYGNTDMNYDSVPFSLPTVPRPSASALPRRLPAVNPYRPQQLQGTRNNESTWDYMGVAKDRNNNCGLNERSDYKDPKGCYKKKILPGSDNGYQSKNYSDDDDDYQRDRNVGVYDGMTYFGPDVTDDARDSYEKRNYSRADSFDKGSLKRPATNEVKEVELTPVVIQNKKSNVTSDTAYIKVLTDLAKADQKRMDAMENKLVEMNSTMTQCCNMFTRYMEFKMGSFNGESGLGLGGKSNAEKTDQTAEKTDHLNDDAFKVLLETGQVAKKGRGAPKTTKQTKGNNIGNKKKQAKVENISVLRKVENVSLNDDDCEDYESETEYFYIGGKSNAENTDQTAEKTDHLNDDAFKVLLETGQVAKKGRGAPKTTKQTKGNNIGNKKKQAKVENVSVLRKVENVSLNDDEYEDYEFLELSEES